MNIKDVVLFTSSNSNASIQIEKVFDSKGLQVQKVRLDTKQDRINASKGKYFQVNVVPTMCVIYADDNTQLFVGCDRIYNWIEMVTKNSKKEEIEYEEEEDTYISPKKPKKKRSKRRAKKVPEFSDDEIEIEFIEPEPMKKKTKGLDTNMRKNKGDARMNNLYNLAKQMEKDRQNTLGYTEKDLPKN